MKNLVVKIKAFFITPKLERLIPPPRVSHGWQTIGNKSLTAEEQKSMHADEMNLLIAQIDEQRAANQHNLSLIHRTLIVAIVGTLISSASVTLSLMVIFLK